MQWSQLRVRLKGRMAESLQARIDIHQTRYRHAHDQEGELWLSVDGEKVFGFGSASYLEKLGSLVHATHQQGASWGEAYTQAWPVMDASGLMLLEKMNRDLFESLSQTVDQILMHQNPLLRALALADARYGRRRLSAFQVSAEHPLVQRIFKLRCEVEGINSPAL